MCVCVFLCLCCPVCRYRPCVGLIPQPRSPTKCLWIEKSIKEGQGPIRTVEASEQNNQPPQPMVQSLNWKIIAVTQFKLTLSPCGPLRFIIVFTKARYLTLSWVTIQSTPRHPFVLVIILPSTHFPKRSLPVRFSDLNFIRISHFLHK
jgi:hypothetical protein